MRAKTSTRTALGEAEASEGVPGVQKSPLSSYWAGIVAIAVAAFCGCAHAGWIGDDAEVTYYVGSVLQFDSGPEQLPFTFDLSTATGVGGSLLDVGPTQIVATFGGSQTFGGGVFNGWVLQDVSKDPDITNVSINPSSNFGPAVVKFTSKSVTVDWGGITIDNASRLVLDVQFGAPALPEPGSLVLLMTALAGLGLSARQMRSS